MTMDATPASTLCAASVRGAVAIFAALIVTLTGFRDTFAMSVSAATVTIDPDKLDLVRVKAAVNPGSFAGASAMRIEIGIFSQVISLSDLRLSEGERGAFRPRKGKHGIRSLYLDLGRGRMRVAADMVADRHPLPIRLTVGRRVECSMLRLRRSSTAWKFKETHDAQFPCVFRDAPTLDPNLVVQNEEKAIAVRIATGDLDPDPGSVQLFGSDASALPLGPVLCTMHDDGLATSADDLPGDRTYGCKLRFTGATRGTQEVVVVALAGGAPVFSPTAELTVVRAITDAEIDEFSASADMAAKAWERRRAQFGDTPRAREATVTDILSLPGMAAAGISDDQIDIWYEHTSGIRGVLMTGRDEGMR